MNMSEEDKDKEKYILQNDKTKMYLKGYEGNKPLWTGDENEAIIYNELDALKMQRRTENLYLPAQKIIIIEKK